LLFNIEELLELAKVKLATNCNDLIYIISLQTIKTDNCRNLELKQNETQINNDKVICNSVIVYADPKYLDQVHDLVNIPPQTNPY